MRLILWLIIIPIPIAPNTLPQIVFWNTGQGLWTTAVRGNKCFHFDMGGEYYNTTKIKQICGTKKNIAYFSHWDWDHIGFASSLKNSDFCISLLPSGEMKKRKKNMLRTLPHCNRQSKRIKAVPIKVSRAKSENERSHVLVFENHLLLPGDSTKKMEKYWSNYIRGRIKILSVAHHGSKTSSSLKFLKRVRPQLAIVSARRKVYGHPHRDVVQRFKNLSIPLIRTEDWGNIRIFDSESLSFHWHKVSK